MANKGEQHAEGVKTSFEGIIGAELSIKRKKKNADDVKLELFEKVILNMDSVNIRSKIIGEEFLIDMDKYEQSFYDIIDSLLQLHFCPQSCDLIFFYVYDRINPDGTMNELQDIEGNIFQLTTPRSLWNLISTCEKEHLTKQK